MRKGFKIGFGKVTLLVFVVVFFAGLIIVYAQNADGNHRRILPESQLDIPMKNYPN